jgi:uncharacterized protein YecT (DUF1311 family)
MKLRAVSKISCLLAVFSLGFAGYVAAEPAIACNRDGTQAELNACARDEFEQADKALNQTYQALLKKEAGDSLFVQKIRIAQKAWLAFRDAELDAYFACAEKNVQICSGSMYPMSYLYRKAELTRARTQQLKDIIEQGRGQ